MLAMPVATTSDDEALSMSPAFVKASRPQASGSHIAEKPSDSSSAAMSPLRSAGNVSWAKVHTPIVPRSFSSEAGEVSIEVTLGTATRQYAEPADASDGLFLPLKHISEP